MTFRDPYIDEGKGIVHWFAYVSDETAFEHPDVNYLMDATEAFTEWCQDGDIKTTEAVVTMHRSHIHAWTEFHIKARLVS